MLKLAVLAGLVALSLGQDKNPKATITSISPRYGSTEGGASFISFACPGPLL